MVGTEHPIGNRSPPGLQSNVPGDRGTEGHDPVMLGPSVETVAVSLGIIGRRGRQGAILHAHAFGLAAIGMIKYHSVRAGGTQLGFGIRMSIGKT